MGFAEGGVFVVAQVLEQKSRLRGFRIAEGSTIATATPHV
jgi:hypothetical protein